jgi:hypothetical protein
MLVIRFFMDVFCGCGGGFIGHFRMAGPMDWEIVGNCEGGLVTTPSPTTDPKSAGVVTRRRHHRHHRATTANRPDQK